MKTTNLYISVLILIASMGLTACNGVESKNAPSQGESTQASLDTIQLDSLDPQLDDMELKLADATKEINALSLISISGISGSTGAEAKAQSLADKIAEVLNKVIDVVEKVAAKKAELRTKINDVVAKLDPTLPNYAELKKRADEMLAYLDKLDAEIKKVHAALIAKIDSKVSMIDVAVGKMSPNSPVTWIVTAVWQTVRVKIVEARDRLAAIKL
ncbi:MAG: hypothetical protein AABZ31_12405 [Bdellovibrionota bacterium]